MFSYVRKHLRPDGERLPLVFEAAGAPAYYPTFLILDRRARNAASGTLERTAHDLIHFGQVLVFEGLVDIHVRFARGYFFDAAEIDAIAQTSSVSTPALTGAVALLCRPRCAFKPLSIRKRRDFSSPVPSVCEADFRIR